jgi:hypothetical protein
MAPRRVDPISLPFASVLPIGAGSVGVAAGSGGGVADRVSDATAGSALDAAAASWTIGSGKTTMRRTSLRDI